MTNFTLLTVIFAVVTISGCANNPNIPTYSGEVRAAVAEKAAEADAYVHSKLSSPMPAWDSTQNGTAQKSPGAEKPSQGSVARNESAPSESATTSSVTTEGVATYSVSPSGEVQKPMTVESTAQEKSAQ